MKLSFQQINERIRKALEKKHPSKPGEYSYAWIVDTFDSEVIYSFKQKYWKADYSVNDKGEVAISNETEVKKEVSYKPIIATATQFNFSDEVEEDDCIVKSGKLFEAGDYPDKGVKFTDKDLDNMVDGFKPVPNDLEHKKSILDGKLGQVRKIWKKDQSVYGEVEVPKWLNKVIGNKPLKVSLAFNRDKQIVGNALVLNPRIKEAAVFAEFNKHYANENEGEKPMSKITMTLSGLAERLGFKADSLEDEVEVDESLFNDDKAETTPGKEETKPEKEEVTTPEFTGAKAEGLSPEVQKQLNELESQNKALANQSLVSHAFAFADNMITSGYALPNQRDEIKNVYHNAVLADNGGQIQFSDDGKPVEGQNVKAVKEMFEKGFKHNFTQEQLAGGEIGVVFNRTSNEVSEDRKNELLKKSSVGRQAIKRKDGN